jgi:hypothetical protein
MSHTGGVLVPDILKHSADFLVVIVQSHKRDRQDAAQVMILSFAERE